MKTFKCEYNNNKKGKQYMANCVSKHKTSDASASCTLPTYSNSQIILEAESFPSLFSSLSCPIQNTMIIDKRKQIQENSPFISSNFYLTSHEKYDGYWKTLTLEEHPQYVHDNFKAWFYRVEQSDRNDHRGVLYCRGKYSSFYIEGCFSENHISDKEKYLKIFGNGMIYYGTLNRQLDPHGQGQLIYGKDDRYFGEFRGGLPHGKGQHISNSQIFVGIFQKGEKKSGVLEQVEGIYEGDFQNNLKDGQGVYKTYKGVKYVGSFRKNRKNGIGQVFDHKGQFLFKAVWKNDKLVSKIQ